MQISPSPGLKQVALLEPLDMEDGDSHYLGHSYVHSQVQNISSSGLDSDSDSMFGSDSDSTPSPPLMSIDTRPITDGVATVGSDDAESLYHSVDEENDQVCSFNYTVQLGIRSWFDRWI